jgi:YD repeat-containing protein
VIAIESLYPNIEAYAYDDAGNVIQKSDGNQVVTIYEYDKVNRIRSNSTMVQGQAVKNSLTYFGDGLIKESIDANNHVTSYTYDGVGRKKTETFGDQGVITYDYDSVGDLKSKVDQVGRETTYKFDVRTDRSEIGV